MDYLTKHTVDPATRDGELFAQGPNLSLSGPPEPSVGPQTSLATSDLDPITMPQPALVRQETVEAIGPSTDLPTPMLPTGDSSSHAGPVIIINLLLTSTGTRHPYKIDERYLSKRGVAAEGADGAFDPFAISVYTLKELIWRDWREGANISFGPLLFCLAPGPMLTSWFRMGAETNIAFSHQIDSFRPPPR